MSDEFIKKVFLPVISALVIVGIPSYFKIIIDSKAKEAKNYTDSKHNKAMGEIRAMKDELKYELRLIKKDQTNLLLHFRLEPTKER